MRSGSANLVAELVLTTLESTRYDTTLVCPPVEDDGTCSINSLRNDWQPGSV